MDKLRYKALYVESLKENFASYNSISIDEFYEFYRNIHGDISRSTAKGYIHELKEGRVIRNIARGLYVLEGEIRKELHDYVAVTMDIIKSTSQDYQTFNKELEEKVLALNKELRVLLNFDREYFISQGDEIQILFPLDDRMGKMLMVTFCHLRPFIARYALSIGSYEGEFKRNSWEMNAPIFWNARDCLKELKGGKSYDGQCVSEYAQVDRLCNNMLPLINKGINRISDKQWAVVQLELLNVDWVDAMEKLAISKTSYYSRLNASSLVEILRAFRTISDLMQKRSMVE
jgi:hypothetical protein